MMVRRDLNPELKAKIQDFFVTYGANEREKAALKKIGIGGFRKSDDNQLLPIRQLELFKSKLAVERDDRLTAAERQAKLADINRRLAALNQQMAALKN
jgi:phosphonate transport system substrate-binding protein